MQIFLPYPDFEQSVRVLDRSRLGNQIWRECLTLIEGHWPNHPVSKMWANHHHAVALYMWHGITELITRNHIPRRTIEQLDSYITSRFPHPQVPRCFDRNAILPPFIGNEAFHRSHRLALLYKNPVWYSKFFNEPIPTSKPEYVWPI